MSGPKSGWWSVSAAKRYEECPKGFWFQYVEKIPRPASEIPLHWRLGTVVHYALEQAWRKRKADRGFGPMWSDEMWTHAKAALAKAWADEDMPAPEVSDGLWDRAHVAVETTLRNENQSWEDIVAVEHKFTLRVGMNIIGFADLLLRPSEGELLIRDWKVRQKASLPQDLERDFQLNLYGEMARRTMPWVRTVTASHYNPPTGVEVKVTLEPEETLAALHRIQAVRDMAAHDTDYTPEKGTWCEGCAYRSMCPAWEKTEAEKILEANLSL